MRRHWYRLLKIGVVAVMVVVALCVLQSAGGYVDRYWMDTVTGSTREIREWNWWGSGNEVIKVSSLERWVVERDGSYQNDWDYVSGLHTSLIPLGKAYGNGGAPPIYSLGSMTEVLDAFVAYAEPEEIDNFIEVMRNGSEDQQESAVQATFDRGLKLLEASSSLN